MRRVADLFSLRVRGRDTQSRVWQKRASTGGYRGSQPTRPASVALPLPRASSSPGRHGMAKSSLTRTSARTPSTRWWPSSTTPTTPSWEFLVPNSPKRMVARPSTSLPRLMPVPRSTTRSVPASRAGHVQEAPGTKRKFIAQVQRASSTCTEASKAWGISPKRNMAGKIRWRRLWSLRPEAKKAAEHTTLSGQRSAASRGGAVDEWARLDLIVRCGGSLVLWLSFPSGQALPVVDSEEVVEPMGRAFAYDASTCIAQHCPFVPRNVGLEGGWREVLCVCVVDFSRTSFLDDVAWACA